MAWVTATIISLVVYFFLPIHCIASSIVINEYFPNPEGSNESAEWIELFNTTDTILDLTGFTLDDSNDGGSSPFVISEGAQIGAHGFYLLERSETGIVLNNDSDSITLQNAAQEILDSVSYSETKEGVSYGRSPDGYLLWVSFATSSKGIANTTGVIIPTPTVTPSPTDSPTKTPASSKTPVLTKTPEPTPTLLPTVKPSVFLTKTVVKPTRTIPGNIQQSSKSAVVSSVKKQVYPTKIPTIAVLGTSEESNNMMFIMLGGALVLGCGILIFYYQHKAEV